MIERIARALCKRDGLAENTKFEGRPMWESFTGKARVVLDAMRQPTAAMIQGAADCESSLVADVYSAMIDAALAEREPN